MGEQLFLAKKRFCKIFTHGTRTHRRLAHARYEHVSWRVPGGVVLLGGAGGWDYAELVRDDGTAEQIFKLQPSIMCVT